MSISWFMRCANEPIAREANHEDNASGHFWASPAHPCAHGTCASLHIGSRFKSQALLDEKALLACMAYVDLNPIRAKMAETPEQSEHTSIQQRIKKAINAQQPGRRDQQPDALFPFVVYPREDMPQGLLFQLNDYLELVDWSGRIYAKTKKALFPITCPIFCNDLIWMQNSLSTSPKTLNTRSKIWLAQRIMFARHVNQLARTGFTAFAIVRRSFQVVNLIF